jgi:hypothetical protein
MGVVKPDQPLAIRPVQRERVVQAAWLLRRLWYRRHHEANPMATLRVHDQHLAVEVEKHIKDPACDDVTTYGYPTNTTL